MKSKLENTKCSICSKNFSSMHALFGHMRFHPERKHRGMQMPQPQTRAPAPTSTSTSTSTSSLPCWSATARRGRKSTTSASAVNDLLSLSQSENQGGALIKKKSTINVRVKKMKEIGNDEYLKNKKLYRCHSCNKEFSSHQALGGHKSSHNKTNKTTTLLDLSQTRRMMDFDLNELPPMDDDGSGDGNGNGNGGATNCSPSCC